MNESEKTVIYFAYEEDDPDQILPDIPATRTVNSEEILFRGAVSDGEDVRGGPRGTATIADTGGNPGLRQTSRSADGTEPPDTLERPEGERIICIADRNARQPGNNKDHDYIELSDDAMEHLSNMDDSTIIIIQDEPGDHKQMAKAVVGKATAGKSPKEKLVSQIRNITELKKVTPRVKLLADEPKGLPELRKIVSHVYAAGQEKIVITEEAKDQLRKYCRTCAGLKVPLVDIFGERGVQMRLSQQMQHLEEINKRDSLSTQMCMDCICDLKMSYKFFMQIKKAEFKLKSIHTTLNDAGSNENKLKNSQLEKTLLPGSLNTNKLSLEKDKNSTVNVPTEEPSPSMPKISAIFSLQELPKLLPVKPKVETKTDARVQADVFERGTVPENNEDNESIEEFDPDDPEFDPEDPPFQPDSSDDVESEDDAENTVTKKSKKLPTPQNKQNMGNDLVYNYDDSKKTYVKMEPADTKEKPPGDGGKSTMMKAEIEDNTMNAADLKKQPNILKRKLPMKTEPISDSEGGGQVLGLFNSSTEKDSKIQKLNVNNPVNVGGTDEEGIMYVTVKGSKPNELLLVKVKKMDKPNEKRDDKGLGKKTFDPKTVSKKYESFKLKEKDAFSEKAKKPDIREQIIEEQIEEYKKRREKVLGGNAAGLANAMKLEDGMVRFVKSGESSGSNRRPLQMNAEKPLVKVNDNVTAEDKVEKEIPESAVVSDTAKPVEPQSPKEKYANSEEYLIRLAKLKQKWEEAKKKRESLQKELEESRTEGNLDKLSRILGEREKNLEDFQEYLKQRKIVINRLKDEDIITLYEDRNSVSGKKTFPDLIDETHPEDYIPEENYLECDYCPETFASIENLEEHLKMHDYKILHYCEDCNTEFPTNKAKKNHNVVCIKKLICKYCDLMLDSKGKKRQHEQKHCDNMNGQLCDVCGEKFKHQGTLDQHVKTQHMSWEKVFQCPKCPKKFAFKQKLSFHVKSVHTTMRAYLCEDCGADFKNPASLRHHRIRKHQPVSNKRECPVCHKVVPFYSLSKHMHTHKAYTIQCPHCDKMFKNSSTLKQHVRIHEDQRQYRCDTCGVGFNRRDGLRLHMRVHEKSDSRGLKECSCQVCGEKFPNHSLLVIHRNRVHKDGRQYTCHICNRSMISTRSLEWHMSHIHNESIPGGGTKEVQDPTKEKKRVTCYHCDKTFKTEMILRTHIKNTHMEKDPMKCLECDETFTSEVRLRHHMMVTHNRLEGTLACPHCPKRFVNQLRLKTHMISHSEDRPYTCEICGFNLKTKIQLIKHHQNRHSDERPLQCKYCPWRCKQVSALVCHERTHTNERPYSCSVCRQRFKYLGDKNKHERRHESLGGSGFKRIVTGRNTKQVKTLDEDTSCSEQEREELDQAETPFNAEEQYEAPGDDQYENKYDEEQMVKFEEQEMEEPYEQTYEHEYEETSREASEAAEVIMSMEDTTVYTEEVTADNLENAEIITDEIITNQILQTGTVVHLQQQDDSGKIQVIPVMLSLPDLSDANAEVNLATASIMYNN